VSRSAWDCRQYATQTDPCHKSDLNEYLGSYGCPARFRFRKLEPRVVSERCDGRRVNGSIIHELIRARLSGEIVPGQTDSDIERLWGEALDREADGREVYWGKTTEEAVRREAVQMLKRAPRLVPGTPVLAEAGFIAPLDPEHRHVVEGHIDLVFRKSDSTLGLLDWKTGQQLPDAIALEHGWEGGIYGLAVRHGLFVPFEVVRNLREWGDTTPGLTGEQVDLIGNAPDHREAMHALLRNLYKRARHHPLPEFVVRFHQDPVDIFHVHLRDCLPYLKGGKKVVDRAEHLAFYGLDRTDTVHYKAGDLRGPALYRVARRPGDIVRLRHALRSFIASIRMGHFPPAIGEQCKRCRFREPCLTSGYLPEDDKRTLQLAIKGLDAHAFHFDDETKDL